MARLSPYRGRCCRFLGFTQYLAMLKILRICGKAIGDSAGDSTDHLGQFNQDSQKALQKLLARTDIGFFRRLDDVHLWESSEQRANELRKKYTTMVVVGVGGSSLGPQTISDILAQPKNTHRLLFWDNVDAIQFERLFKNIDLDKTCWTFISKSGSTLETLAALNFAAQSYRQVGKDIYPHCTVISEKKQNPLMNWAKEHQVPTLEIPLDIGGRFSVLTPVGMLPTAFLGIQISEMREGAKLALKETQQISLFMSEAMMSFRRFEWISFFWFYSSEFRSFGGWLSQLWAESLAKKEAHRVSTPMMSIGACDQHSLLQQVMEGAKDKWVVFFRFLECEGGKAKLAEKLEKSEFPSQDFLLKKSLGEILAAEAVGTERALHLQQISTMSLMVDEVSPRSAGYLFMFFMLVVAGLGEQLGLNAFDQPGVELGKRLAKEILEN